MKRVIAAAFVAALTVTGFTVPAHAANQLDRSFTANGMTSTYHLFDEGLDTSRPVGLMIYADGSGAYGFHNHTSTYLLDSDGSNGLVATARKHNMILLVPKAPPPGCDYDGNTAPDTGENANCWYDGARGPYLARDKAAWSSALIHDVKGRYQVDDTRIVVGGFSSGAQWATQFFGPAHAEEHSVDLTVAIGYGGAPVATPRFSEAYKRASAWSWDTGTADNAYRTDRYGSVGGYNWYTAQGFRTFATWPAGVRHDRPNQFHRIMDREITRWLDTQPTPSPTPTPPVTPTPSASPTPSPTAQPTKAEPTRDGRKHHRHRHHWRWWRR